MNSEKKLNVGVLGSGNIGTDLLIKALRSKWLNCNLFVGRSFASPGMRRASQLGVKISDQSIDAFKRDPGACNVVFDATSAAFHKQHDIEFRKLGIKSIDMTPSQIGKMCVPALNLEECVEEPNVNMITCGGQASIPIAYALMQSQPGIQYIEVVSSIASRSAGPGTRANIDEYIQNTEAGLRELAGCEHVKAILNLNPADPCIDMQTTIFAQVERCDIEAIKKAVADMETRIQSYVPGYKVVVPPVFDNGRVMVMVRVQGLGDYLPSYAGNLDIINCAAIAMVEAFAKAH